MFCLDSDRFGGIGGGLAVACALVFKRYAHQVLAHVIGVLLVIWGASIFVYAIFSYRRTCARLSQEGLSRNSLGAMILMTAMLLIIATLVFWSYAPINGGCDLSPRLSFLRL